MGSRPDFIGLGAQRSGTSWVYSCLLEHPQICIPVKEIHFFSRERNWDKGYEWYESIFSECPNECKKGEFSTSYLFDPDTPRRIYRKYPDAKLMAILRNPMDRAYSNYRNDIVSGELEPNVTFQQAIDANPIFLEQGRYMFQIKRYLEYFPDDQLFFSIYEDALIDPEQYIRNFYHFIGVDTTFQPYFLNKKINAGRIPKYRFLETVISKTSKYIQKKKYDQLWLALKKTGISRWVRQLNNQQSRANSENEKMVYRKQLYGFYESEIGDLERYLGRNLKGWRM